MWQPKKKKERMKSVPRTLENLLSGWESERKSAPSLLENIQTSITHEGRRVIRPRTIHSFCGLEESENGKGVGRRWCGRLNKEDLMLACFMPTTNCLFLLNINILILFNILFETLHHYICSSKPESGLRSLYIPLEIQFSCVYIW